ncbi:MAG: hypothetical protein C0406_07150 [Sideroxydans sp.]|nr:hypothetical protein [Sideroxydans sp.]
MPATDSASADTRYTFTGQFLEASAMFVRRAREIEQSATELTDDATRCEHRGLVCSVIMQCVAALETEAHEICTHGPSSHLGSNGTDTAAKNFLLPVSEFVDNQSALDRFDLILHLLKRPCLDKGANPYQSTAMVVRLRNEIIHYKSKWGVEMERSKLQNALRTLAHKPPPFAHPSMNFFPHLCLSADCAAWALASVVEFLETFYVALGVPSRFASYRQRLVP